MNGKQYLYNFYTYIEELDFKEVLLFIVTLIGRVIFNLFSHITIKHFTSSHVVLLLIMGELTIDWGEKDKIETIIIFMIFFVELIMILIFCEIIELNFCGFEKNTRKNIKQRADLTINYEDDFSSNDIGEGIEMISEGSSLNNSVVEKIENQI